MIMSSSETESGSDDQVAWIRWFLSLKGNEFFCRVDDEYIRDRFNLIGMNSETMIPHYNAAVQLILGQLSGLDNDADLNDDAHDAVEKSARHVYGLIHARYILTPTGMNKMFQKYRAGDFGKCPRVLCGGQTLFPIGLSDVPAQKSVKVFCPKCEDVYSPKSHRHTSIDGAYFGTTFPHLLLLQFPEHMPKKDTKTRYTPTIFGFKIHQYQQIYREQDFLLRS